jgi:hypothetical protein
MVVTLDRPVPRRSPVEHARRRAERLADRRLFSPPERARSLPASGALPTSDARADATSSARRCGELLRAIEPGERVDRN